MNSPTLFCDACGAANQSQASFCRTCGSTLQGAGAPSRNTATGRLLTNHLLKQRYRIVAPVGKGGMGTVYEAEDTQLGNRKVAVKEMSQRGLSQQETIEAADAFKQEAHILAGLQHPNLPNIYDHFYEAGHWYLVMSFIRGETLGEYLKKKNGGKLPTEEALQIGIQLCTVLHYLHTQQPPIIFRDLKPSNIMRTTEGDLYLIDFGIARHFKPGQTKDTSIYGSTGYASPEQYGNAQTTPRSDIYSLGVVLYQLLSGHNPSTTPFRLPPLQSQVPTISNELATLITQMTELNMNNRPDNIFAIKQRLLNIVAYSGGTAQSLPFILPSDLPPPPPPFILPSNFLPPPPPTILSSNLPPPPPPPPTVAAIPPMPYPHANTTIQVHRSNLLPGVIGAIIVTIIIAVSGMLYFSHAISNGSNPAPTSTPSPSVQQPVLTSGTWHGRGTFYNGQPPFDMVLNISSVNGNTFSGTLEEDTYNSTVAIIGSITSRSGNSISITFTDNATVSGSQIQLNCTYIATIANGQMNGTWSYPGHSSADGTISLTKTG